MKLPTQKISGNCGEQLDKQKQMKASYLSGLRLAYDQAKCVDSSGEPTEVQKCGFGQLNHNKLASDAV